MKDDVSTFNQTVISHSVSIKQLETQMGQKEDYRVTPWPIPRMNLERIGEPDFDRCLNQLTCWRFCKTRCAKFLLGASSSGSAMQSSELDFLLIVWNRLLGGGGTLGYFARLALQPSASEFTLRSLDRLFIIHICGLSFATFDDMPELAEFTR
ncbi:hypothetical protein H5410_046677 [Solanum commersonii]|uniref:Uncharacterized protein n=1 Tax=Solanum commersonii TaxID=4109 RepID=A0A9J5XCY0_SOLCO|nr:hypothetical protein H5410_046677 [Solanum commersonii]